ncbi:MAG: NUDIX hydrolase [Victivallaceae bacterium]|nr:NUDIX hydrolase [Victivallaceae bacterium]
MTPSIDRVDVQHAGKYLELCTVHFTDERSRNRQWESVRRVGGRGAAGIVAYLMPGQTLILVRQFRPPSGKYILEFPAGLIDPGETPAETAERELYEETGYRGKILRSTAGVYSSPGMSAETIHLVFMEVNSADYPTCPQTHQESSENIEVLLVPKTELKAFLAAEEANGVGIDSKLMLYACAL